MCKYLENIIREGRYIVGHCRIKHNPPENFLEIKNSFENLYPDAYCPMNNECPFCPYQTCSDCALYDE